MDIISNRGVNGWFFCDDVDTYRWGKKVNPFTYKFIQLNWLDTVGDDRDTYCVNTGTISLREYSLDEMEMAISGLYEDLASLICTAESTEEAVMTITECIFEENQTDGNCVSDVIPLAKAKELIDSYIAA